MRLTVKAAISLFTSFILLTSTRPCAAQESKAACRDAYEESQVARKNGELLSARAKLRTCAGESCPGIVRMDCIEWLGQVDRAIPSILVEAKSDEGDVFDVAVALDGRMLATSLDGRPIELDPGLHTVRFSKEGKPSIEQKIVAREGEKSRTVVASWRAVPTAPAEPPSLPQRDTVRPIRRPFSYWVGWVSPASVALPHSRYWLGQRNSSSPIRAHHSARTNECGPSKWTICWPTSRLESESGPWWGRRYRLPSDRRYHAPKPTRVASKG